ncbi:MAG: ABC transporter permease [Anaerolineae bacterium]|nr:ABC transporter permease [Anaerolineae bacterium]
MAVTDTNTNLSTNKPTAAQSVGIFLRGLLARQEAAVLIPFIVLTLFFYLRNAAMLSPLTVTSILRTMALPGLIGMGMVMLMISGEIDLSTASVMSLTAVFASVLMRDAGMSFLVASICALVVAIVVGLVNALLTVKIGVHAVLTTLGVGFAVRGISYMFSNGLPIYPLPPEVTEFGSLRPLGVSSAFTLMLIVMVVVQLILNRTRWGAMIFATGSNKLAAQTSGINTNLVKTLCFVATSFLAGCSGLLYMSQLPMPAGDPIIGRNLELDIIAGVILGGVSFFGGRGSAVGTLFGVMLMQIVRTGMVVARFDPYLQVPVLGILMILAASVDVIRHRRRER